MTPKTERMKLTVREEIKKRGRKLEDSQFPISKHPTQR